MQTRNAAGKYQKYTPSGDYGSDICGLPVTTYTGVKPETQLNELVRAFVAGTDDAAERIAACVGEQVTCTGIKLWARIQMHQVQSAVPWA